MNWPHEPLEAEPMVKSRPLFLLVTTLVLVILALGMFWFAILPQRLLAQVTHTLNSSQGMSLEASGPKLRFDEGLVLQLDDVALSQGERTFVTARQVNIDLTPVALFGGRVETDALELLSPIFTFELRNGFSNLALPARRVTWRDGIVRLKDSTLKSVLAVADVNGQFTRQDDGAGNLSASFMLNNKLSTLSADISDLSRVGRDGSPADIVLAGRGPAITISGRLKAVDALTLDGQMNVRAPAAADLMAWMGVPLQSLADVGSVSAEAGLSLQGLEAKLKVLTLSTPQGALKGDITWRAGADKPSLTGQVMLDSLALWPAENVLLAPWPETDLPVDDFFAADLGMKVEVQKLVLRGVDLGPVVVEVLHANGVLSLNTGNGLAVQLQQKQGDVEMRVNIDSPQVAAKAWSQALLGMVLLEGAVDVKAKLSATGRHWAGLISTLNGDVLATAAKATFNIDLAAHGVASGEGWTPGTGTGAVAIKADVNEGIAKLDGTTLGHAGGTFAPTGEVDLLRQAFEVSLHPRGKAVDKDLLLTGRWVQPRFAAGTAPALRLQATPAPQPPAN